MLNVSNMSSYPKLNANEPRMNKNSQKLSFWRNKIIIFPFFSNYFQIFIIRILFQKFSNL